MQYSPYSANMNPYQTIYNNGGASAYQPTWGYTDLFGHVFDTSPDLPLGYTRQQYNEERAMAAESMWRSPLLGFGTFATGTVVSHVTFGSPLQNLARLTGGTAGLNAYNAGFGGPSDLGARAWNAFDEWHQIARSAHTNAPGIAEAGKAAGARLADINRQIDQYTSNLGTFWGKVGRFSRGVSLFKESVAETTANLMGVGGRVVGNVASAGVQGFGGLAELGLNHMTHGAMSPWLERQGTTLYNMATRSGGWMTEASSKLATLASYEADLAKATSALRSATTIEAAAEAQSHILAAERGISTITSTHHGFGGMLTKLKGGAANAVKSVGEILRSGKGISGVLGAGLKVGITGVTKLASPVLASFLNPITSAEMYLMEQTIGYTTDAYQNYQTENEIKRNLMAKGGRILQYGFADGDRGLQGGFSTAQQNRLVSKIRDMAAIGASQGDMFGLGADSLFGGHGRYSERMRELKSILSVGTDMGFFDMSRSMDDFEKKFEQTVKTVDKLSKMLRRTKGEIMTVMANVQNTEGLYGMSAINASVLKKDYAARLSGVDLTTAMQESAAGAQMGRQAGFSAAMGANLMSDSRIMMSNAIRSGDLSREDIFRLGGEQGVVTNIQQGYLNAMNDPVLKAELAMGMVRDPVTGKMRFDDARLRRLATASDAELREMSRERYAFVNTTSYSNIRHASFKGGKMYDAMRYLKTALASGDVSQEQYNMAIAGTVRQKLLAYHINETSPQYQESLRLELENLTGDPATADIIAKQMLGGYAGMQVHNNLVVAADRYREGYEKQGFGFGTLFWQGSSNKIGRMAGGAGALIGGSIGFALGGAGGAGVGTTLGYNAGQLIYTGAGVLANWIDPASNIALAYRDQVKQELRAQGINPNYLDTYLFGKSDAEKVAELSHDQLVTKLKFGSSNDFITSKSDVSNYDVSYAWLTMKSGSEDFKKSSEKEKSRMIAKAERANKTSGKGVNGTFAGYLNYLDSDLKEFGLSAEETKAIKSIQYAIENGEMYDATGIGGESLKKIGRVLETSIAAGVKNGLDRDIMIDTLMNTVQTSEADFWAFGKSKVTEAFLRDKGIGRQEMLRAREKAGIFSSWMYGADTAIEAEIAGQGKLTTGDYLITTVLGNNPLTTNLVVPYLIYANSSAGKANLEKYRTAASAMSEDTVMQLSEFVKNPNSKVRQNWLKQNSDAIIPFLDKDTFKDEIGAMRALMQGETLSEEQQAKLSTLSNSMLLLKNHDAADRMARRVMSIYSQRTDDKTDLDENLSLLAGSLTKKGKGDLEKILAEKNISSRKFLEQMLEEGKAFTNVLSADERAAIQNALNKKDLSDKELIQEAASQVVATTIEKESVPSIDKKSKIDYNSGTGDALWKTSELCHSAATILERVITRLGF